MSDSSSSAPCSVKQCRTTKNNTHWLRVHFEVKDYGIARVLFFDILSNVSLTLLSRRQWRQLQCLKNRALTPPSTFCSSHLKGYVTENLPFVCWIPVCVARRTLRSSLLCGAQQQRLHRIQSSYDKLQPAKTKWKTCIAAYERYPHRRYSEWLLKNKQRRNSRIWSWFK